MTMLQIALALATLLCSLVAGLLFAFAVVVMPGLKRLDDRAFLRAFQAIDRVIQGNQPIFMLVWVGSALSLVAAMGLGMRELSGADQLLLLGAVILYLLGVQAPTIAINVPLNNVVQRLNLAAMSETDLHHARATFEPRWNRWNIVRAICASFTSIALMLLIVRM